MGRCVDWWTPAVESGVPMHARTHAPSANTPTSSTPPPQKKIKAAIKAFYLLIFGAAALRSLWFFIPSDVLEPSYAPAEVWAFQTPVRARVMWCGGIIYVHACALLLLLLLLPPPVCAVIIGLVSGYR